MPSGLEVSTNGMPNGNSCFVTKSSIACFTLAASSTPSINSTSVRISKACSNIWRVWSERLSSLLMKKRTKLVSSSSPLQPLLCCRNILANFWMGSRSGTRWMRSAFSETSASAKKYSSCCKDQDLPVPGPARTSTGCVRRAPDMRASRSRSNSGTKSRIVCTLLKASCCTPAIGRAFFNWLCGNGGVDEPSAKRTIQRPLRSMCSTQPSLPCAQTRSLRPISKPATHSRSSKAILATSAAGT
mmetsp:Transcript_147973/g.376109  ORF Transcript_147973/g.376109 Transcript_147973/m.376109 type:complete len:243 (+) Transcript_147973:1034-1762(+)